MSDKKRATLVVFKSFGWFGALGLLFAIAKVFQIGEVANWSWWLVLLPFYGGTALVLGFYALIIGGFILFGLFGVAFILLAEAWDKIIAARTRRRRMRRQTSLR